MEPLLKLLSGKNWEVINAGVNGYNTQQEETYLRIEGLRYEPDIVVLTFLDNDLDPMIDPNSVTWRRYPAWPRSLAEAMGRMTSLSYAYQAGRMFMRARQLATQRTGEAEAPASEKLTSDPRWPMAKARLGAIAQLCAGRGIRFIVVHFSQVGHAFVSELQAAGIDTISLEEASARVPPEQSYVSKHDPHPSPAVHRAIAELLVRELSGRGWLE
jgi:hypothetical protein